MNITLIPNVGKGIHTEPKIKFRIKTKTKQRTELKELSKHHYPLVYFAGEKNKAKPDVSVKFSYPKNKQNEIKIKVKVNLSPEETQKLKQEQEKAIALKNNLIELKKDSPVLLQMLCPLPEKSQVSSKDLKELQDLESKIKNSPLKDIRKEKELLKNIDSISQEKEPEKKSEYFKALSSHINNVSEKENIQPDLLLKLFKMIILTDQDGSKFNKYLNDFKNFNDFTKEKWNDFPNHDQSYNARLSPTYRKIYLEENSPQLISAIAISGKDTLVEKFKQKQVKFEDYLSAIKNISKNKKLAGIIANLCFNSKTNKPLPQDKIALVELSNLYINEEKSENLQVQLQGMETNKVLNLDELKKNYIKMFIKSESLGMTSAELEKCEKNGFNNWDFNYIHTLPKALDWLRLRDKEGEANLVNLVKVALKGDYKKFIFDKGTDLGKANNQTKQDFEDAGLNFDIWMNNHKKVKPVKFKHNNEDYEISLWERKPEHDLFIGSYGGGCISLDSRRNKGIIDALSYTMTQFAEIKKNDKTVGYARGYWATPESPKKNKIDPDPVLIIDNIHYNNHDDDSKENLIKPISDFMQQYGKQVAHKPVKTYLWANANLVINSHNAKITNKKTSWLNIKVMGKTTNNGYYLNSINDLDWCCITNPYNIEVYDLSKIYPLNTTAVINK